MVDYHAATLLEMGPGSSFLDVFKNNAYYDSHEGFSWHLSNESLEQCRRRWLWLRKDVLDRVNPPWFV